MLLPQSDAFQLIRGRLACLPGPGLALPHRSQAREQRRAKKKKHMQEIDFPSLLEHFQVKFEHNIDNCSTSTSRLICFLS